MSALPHRDPKGADLGCSSGTHVSGRAVWDSFWPRSSQRVPGAELSAGVRSRRNTAANSKTSLQGKPRGHRWRKLQKCIPDPKFNANIGAASRYFANKPTCRDQGLHKCSALDFSTHITGKKSLKQYILRWWGFFFDDADTITQGRPQGLYKSPQRAYFPALLTNREQIQTCDMIGP